MKLVRGIVRSDKVNKVAAALERADVSGLTVMDVQGRGGHPHAAMYRGTPYNALLPMSAIDVITSDETVDDIARILVDHAQTGEHGDGHVIVMTVEDHYAIRTGWRGVA